LQVRPSAFLGFGELVSERSALMSMPSYSNSIDCCIQCNATQKVRFMRSKCLTASIIHCQGLNCTQRLGPTAVGRFRVQCKYWSYCGGSAGCDGACHRAVLDLNYTASSLCRRDDNWRQCVAPSYQYMLTVGQAALLTWCCETAGVFMQALMSQLAHPLTRWAGSWRHILSSLYMATGAPASYMTTPLGTPAC